MQASALHVLHGVCYALLVYDVGLSIDLEACAQRLTTVTQRVRIRPKHRTPQYFEYRLAPLHITQGATVLSFGNYCSSTSVDVVLYDFGAVTLTYQIPLQGPFLGLLELSDALDDNTLLLQDARRRLEQLLEVVHDAVHRPRIADCVEDYAIFQITAFTAPCSTDELYTTYAQEVAQILRLEHVALSEQEVHDAISHRIAFGLDDVAIIDWHAALLFDREADDVRAVLTFANVELLEMRYLDEQLDEAMDQAYEVLSRRTWNWWRRPGSTAADLHRVAQMQVESAMLFEGVNNALKLLGDQYLARVYRLASQRFHLEEWDASIIRKLHTLESIYEKISDRATTQRMEVLEWIIIILIAVSIVLPFIAGLPQH
jgi:hypothetical protein